jgi:hypothetical protein
MWLVASTITNFKSLSKARNEGYLHMERSIYTIMHRRLKGESQETEKWRKGNEEGRNPTEGVITATAHSWLKDKLAFALGHQGYYIKLHTHLGIDLPGHRSCRSTIRLCCRSVELFRSRRQPKTRGRRVLEPHSHTEQLLVRQAC